MLCIKNGTLVAPQGRWRANIFIENGKIVPESCADPSAECYDASGCLIFPGFIDAHTHLEMDTGTTVTADDFPSGTGAALIGGTTVILDFATQERGGTLSDALRIWHSRADGRCACDYGFHMAVTEWNDAVRAELPIMAEQGVTSFKAYMAYDNLRLNDDELRELFAAARGIGVVGVHCELGDMVNRRVSELLDEGHIEPLWHPRSRPNEVEALAVRRCLELAREANGNAWVVHLSTREGLDEIASARALGQNILCETCPQYLTLTDDVYDAPDFEGAKFVCSPPIRSETDREGLWKGIYENNIDIISTDHCSFRFRGQKELGKDSFADIPNGLPGIEHRPALLWTYGVAAGRITAERFVDLLSAEPARRFGLSGKKGNLEPGADADIVIWDPDAEWTLTADTIHMAADYSPWEGCAMKGRARAVFLRGELSAENGRIIRPNDGQYLFRGPSL
ncbi:MAG: dihydropyrimidinase [Eubacteriales bacterium]|nr:dihydropyrimidinase [Eubacteriales bacterium]